jgi:mitochondrial import receptor subunit TOM40
MSSRGIFKTFSNFFGGEKAQCESNEVSMDDPAFAKLDPHLKYEEYDKPAEDEQMPPFARKSLRKPPGFDVILNAVKSITKKVEHIKGFRFEVGGAPSPKFQMLHQWNITDVSEAQGGRMNPMAMMGGGGGPGGPKQLGTYSLNCSYIGGNLMEASPIYFDRKT